MRGNSIIPAPVAFLPLFAAIALAAAEPSANVRDLNTPREFPEINSPGQWQARAREIREQILVSSGLWPMPEKTPLNAVVFGKIIRDGYSVEKVYFQTYPGFYLAGNLYRPLGKGKGPFPAILNPHGHWENGRMADQKECSIAGRCINFARQGMIAFSYDMVGYNDTRFADSPTNVPFYKIHRSFATNDPICQLWSISLMGLQTWNSIRALDFLESLPDADPHRLACTGESGGGTQTFMLGAIDDRLAAQAPVVMVSHTMQGGCLCENMPGLRVEFSNMEIVAAAAPRPQILVGATGDWTKTMLTVEGPAIENIYELFNKPENLRYVRFDFNHNYNQTSREAVYQWFNKWLLLQPQARIMFSKPDVPVKELPFQMEPDQDLRVFPDGMLPHDALTQAGLIQYLTSTRRSRLDAIQPHDLASWVKYRDAIYPVWRATMHRESRLNFDNKIKSKPVTNEENRHRDYTTSVLEIGRKGDEKTEVKVLVFRTKQIEARATLGFSPMLVVLADAQGSAPFCDESGSPMGLARLLLDKHLDVAVMDSAEKPSPDQTSIFFNTYNRTVLQTEVQQLMYVCRGSCASRVVLCGTGRAGLWCLLAAPDAAAVVADCAQVDVSDDQNVLAPDLFCPGLRMMDTFAGAAAIAAPRPLLLHNFDKSFPVAMLRASRKAWKAQDKFRAESRRLTDDEIVTWISQLK